MLGPLSLMVPEGFEQVAYGHDAATGLRAIVAIHSTVLGPGARRHPLLALRDRGATRSSTSAASPRG